MERMVEVLCIFITHISCPHLLKHIGSTFKKPLILLTEYIYVFSVILRINNCYLSTQH